MSERRWRILFVPHGSAASRVLEVSQTALRIVASLVITGVAVVFLIGYAALSKGVDVVRHDLLETENQRLAAELGRMESRVGALTDTLGTIEAQETRIRLLANLSPLDPDLHDAGIGGPAGSTPAGNLNSALVSRARTSRGDLNTLIRRANLLAWSFREAAESLSSHTDRLEATPSIMPTSGWLSSAFSSMRTHPVLHVARPHEGIDVTAPAGTPIEAPATGTVVKAGWENGYGNMVEVDHGYGIVTLYAHASRLVVQRGQRVQRGQVIGFVGRSGLAVGPHLHYEVHVNGHPVNPLRYILPNVIAD
ncbi:MAG: M23 family metallopeptidase [Gemmatimonadota bacterium]|mgnify:FL=1